MAIYDSKNKFTDESELENRVRLD